MPVIGRAVDVLQLATGRTLPCDPAREVVILIEGQALLEDSLHRPIAMIGPGRSIGGRDRRDTDGRCITAVSKVRCVVITRRELWPLLDMAPGVARAIDAAIDEPARRPAVAERPFLPSDVG
jgi:hypothetical protein